MFTLPFKREHLDLTEEEWEYVEKLIAEPTAVMIWEEGEIDAPKMMALGTCLESDGTGIMRLHVYHPCQSDPTELLSWEGTYPHGKKCPACKEKYTKNNTTYDIEIIVKYPLVLE